MPPFRFRILHSILWILLEAPAFEINPYSFLFLSLLLHLFSWIEKYYSGITPESMDNSTRTKYAVSIVIIIIIYKQIHKMLDITRTNIYNYFYWATLILIPACNCNIYIYIYIYIYIHTLSGKAVVSLTSLNLSFNTFTEFPSSLSSLIALESLNLSGNQITQISEHISSLVNLRYIT